MSHGNEAHNWELPEDEAAQTEALTLKRDKEAKEKSRKGPRPSKRTLEEQKGKAREIFSRTLEEEEQALTLEALRSKEKPPSFEDCVAAEKEIMEMMEKLSPELRQYIGELTPRLEAAIKQNDQLAKSGDKRAGIFSMVKFLEDEKKWIDKIPDQKIRDQLMGYIAAGIDAENTLKQAEKFSKDTVKAEGMKLVPVIGPAVMGWEAARGETYDGKPLKGGRRAWHATKAVALEVMEIGGVLTVGGTTAMAEGFIAVRGAKAGADVARIVKVLTKFAAVARASKALNAAHTVYKIGHMVKHDVELASVIIKSARIRENSKKYAGFADSKDKTDATIIDLAGRVRKNHTRPAPNQPAENDNSALAA